MRVKVCGVLSAAVPVTSGVPQGSVLGPILFIIYVNHVTSGIDCKYKIFADDIKMLFSFETDALARNITNHFQICIDKLVENSQSWGLKMNSEKCVAMRFCSKRNQIITSGTSPYNILGSSIKFVKTYSDLGVSVDRDLKFHTHVSRKAAMANNLASNLLTRTVSRSPDFLMNIFRSHIRPLLEYGSPLWNTGYIGDSKKLENVQRR